MGHEDGYSFALRAVKRHGFHWGYVIKNNDPEKRGRVTVNIPNVVEESDWALPLGFAASGNRKATNSGGAYSVPKGGAMVAVCWIMGDFDQPFYLPGPPVLQGGVTTAPKKVQEQTADDAPDVHVLAETENFQVYICDTDTEQRLVLGGLEDDSEVISVNLQDGSIRLTASTYLILEAPRIAINATGDLRLNNRLVGGVGPKI